VAKELGVKQLVLFHHDPVQSDEAVAEKERRARAIFPETVAARKVSSSSCELWAVSCD